MEYEHEDTEPRSSAVPAGPPIEEPQPAPVLQQERIQSIDVLRGFALLGILVMNIMAFSMPGSAYFIPTAYGDLEGVNYVVWYLSHLFADQKFMTIFSMLFGAGIVLMTSRTEAKGRSSAGVHYRRTAILLVFGLLHAYLLWFGDILYSYAMCGFLLFFVRKLKAPWLILIGVCLLAIGWAFNTLTGIMFESGVVPEEQVREVVRDMFPPPEKLEDEVAAYQGSWFEQIRFRAGDVLMFQTFVFAFYIFWRVAGNMLLGMALYKLGVFSAKRSMRAYFAFVLLGYGIGIPLIMRGVSLNEANDWDPLTAFFINSGWNYWGSMFVALAHVGLVMLVCKSGVLAVLRHALAAVGQMALTNYLMHTFVCVFIFYGGYGLGYFGTFERWQQAIVVVAIWIAQLIISPIWMKAFRFGPFEWLWRTLTYGRWQPMRRAGGGAEVGC